MEALIRDEADESEVETVTVPALVIGAGAAGARAAIELKQNGA